MRVGDSIANRYEIVRTARSGASGTVFEAFDRRMHRKVAVKVISPTREDEGLLVRIEREVRILSDLSHPNVVSCHGSGSLPDGHLYLILDWLEGQDLADFNTQGVGTLGSALEIIRQVASALSAAHAKGIIHRDVKPANVFIVNPDPARAMEVRVLDFGVAKADEPLEVGGVTRAGAILGTPSYMAPEQANLAASVDGRADIFSLGVLAFELMTGQLPWKSRSDLARLARIHIDHAIPIRELNPRVPPEVSELVDQMMSHEPSLRPATMDEIVRRVQRLSFEVSRDLLDDRYAVSTENLEEFVRQETRAAYQRPKSLADPILEQRIKEPELPRITGGKKEPTSPTRIVDSALLRRGRSAGAPGADRASSVPEVPLGVPVRPESAVTGMIPEPDPAEFSEEVTRDKPVPADPRSEPFLSGIRYVQVSGAPVATWPLSKMPEVKLGSQSLSPAPIAAPSTRLPSDLEKNPPVVRGGPADSVDSQLAHLLPEGGLPLFGRGPLIERLRSLAVRPVALERPSCTLLIGPAGIGKTRLRAELTRVVRTKATSRVVLSGRCEETTRATPYGFLRQVLRSEAKVHPGDTLEIRQEKLGALLPNAEEVSRILRRVASKKRTQSSEERTRLGAPKDEVPSLVEAMSDAFDVDVAPVLAETELDRAAILAFLGQALQVPFPEMPPIAGALRDPRVMALETRRAIDFVLAELARRRGLVILVDDAHLIDRQSAEALAALLNPERKLPIVLLAFALPTIREDHGNARSLIGPESTMIEVPPLETPFAKEMAMHLAGGPIRLDSLEILVQRAAGNPLYLEQLVRALKETKVLNLEKGGEYALSGLSGEASDLDRVPPTVAAAVRARLRSLPIELQRALLTAAIFGELFWLEGVAEISDQNLEDTALRFDQLLLLDYVRKRARSRFRDTTELEFAHSVIRRVVLSKVKLSRREGLEERALKFLEEVSETDEATLALHAVHADDRQEAARRYVEAAKHALAGGALHAAESLIEEGISLLDQSPDSRDPVTTEKDRDGQLTNEGQLGRLRVDLVDLSAQSAELLEDYERAEQALALLISLATSDELRATATSRRALLALKRHRIEEAGLFAAEARERWGKLRATLDEAEARLTQAEVLDLSGDPRNALRELLSAKTSAQNLGSRSALARAARGLARISLCSGDYRSAETRFRECLGHARATFDVEAAFDALLGLAEVKRRLGESKPAFEFLDAAERSAITSSARYFVRLRRAISWAEGGEIEQAQESLLKINEETQGAPAHAGVYRMALLERVQLWVGFSKDLEPSPKAAELLAEELERALFAVDREAPCLRLPLEISLAVAKGILGQHVQALELCAKNIPLFAQRGSVHEIEVERLWLSIARVQKGADPQSEACKKAHRQAVAQLDLISSRLERAMRGPFLRRMVSRTILRDARAVGLIVMRDEKSGRLSVESG